MNSARHEASSRTRGQMVQDACANRNPRNRHGFDQCPNPDGMRANAPFPAGKAGSGARAAGRTKAILRPRGTGPGAVLGGRAAARRLWPLSRIVSRLTLFEGAPIAVSDGRPRRLGDGEAEGALRRPDCGQAWRRARGRQGQALRARLRASLTAPARDASSALARPGRGNGRPAEQGNSDPGSGIGAAWRLSKQASAGCRADERGLSHSQAFLFPFRVAVERLGTGTGNGATIRGSRAGSRRRS